MAMIDEFVGGKAADAMAPYLEKEHPDQLTTEGAMLDWLDNEYTTRHEKADAKYYFRHEMVMKYGQPFHEFQNEFVAKAGIIHLPKDDWKEEIHDKLALHQSRLRDKLIPTYHDENSTFNDYCRLAQRYDADQHRTELLRNRAKAKDDSKGGNDKGNKDGKNGKNGKDAKKDKEAAPAAGRGAQRNNGAAPSGGTWIDRAKANGASQEEVKRRIDTHACYACGSNDHRIGDCPDRAAQQEKHRRTQVTQIEAAFNGPIKSNVDKLEKEASEDKSVSFSKN